MQITLPKITPGEWESEHDRAKFDSSLDLMAVFAKDIRLATINVRPFAPHLTEPAANLQAISAVPDLLAALADLLMNLDETGLATMPGDVFANMRETTERARAALSKAGCTIED